MKIEVNIDKKYFFAILGAIIILTGIIAVYAVWDTSKTVWHDSNEIKVQNASGSSVSLQEYINSQPSITVSGTSIPCKWIGWSSSGGNVWTGDPDVDPVGNYWDIALYCDNGKITNSSLFVAVLS